MKIIVDAMGGDNAPYEIVKGVYEASLENDAYYILVGNKAVVEKITNECNFDKNRFEIYHTDEVITMDDDPLCVVKAKKNSSISTGLRLLAQSYGDAFVSAGNTGALFAGATLIVKVIKGMHRAAIGTVLPFSPPVLLLDAGANLVVSELNIEEFAVMGSAYMGKMFNLASPRVGLLNNGSEKSKGTELQTKSYQRLTNNKNINFVGNIEANKMTDNTCDVLVCDGFTGNVLLKSIEGMGKYIMRIAKSAFTSNDGSSVDSGMKMQLSALVKNFDSTEHGGAPLLGISKPVIKAHGSSNAKAFKNAIKQSLSYCSTNIVDDIARESADIKRVDTTTA